MTRDERNNETIQLLKAKLVKKTKKLENVVDWFLDKDEVNKSVGESFTLGTPDNKKMLSVSALLPAVPIAIGLGSALVGLVVLFPLLGGPGVNEAEQQFLKDVTNTGANLMQFGAGSLSLGAKLSTIPIGLTALSVPKKLFSLLTEEVDKKLHPTVIENKYVIALINDVLAKKDDPSLNFPKYFLKRVDIRHNSEKINIDLLKHLAYYRYCIKGVQKGKLQEEDVRDAYKLFVEFLKNAKSSFWVSKEFKENRFVNLLIDEEAYKAEDFYPVMRK